MTIHRLGILILRQLIFRTYIHTYICVCVCVFCMKFVIILLACLAVCHSIPVSRGTCLQVISVTVDCDEEYDLFGKFESVLWTLETMRFSKSTRANFCQYKKEKKKIFEDSFPFCRLWVDMSADRYLIVSRDVVLTSLNRCLCCVCMRPTHFSG